MARRTPLVCQYIENLSSAALEEYADIVKEIVGGRHGLYALYKRDRLYYVGLASNLRNRLRTHLKDRHKGLWDRFSVYLTLSDEHLKELESLALRIMQPKGNRNRGKFAKCENLVGTLRRRLRERHREETLRMLGRDMKLVARRGPRKKRDRDEPVLKGIFQRPTVLRGRFKKNDYRARVRKDGTIRCNGEVFNSPSLAAQAVTGTAKNGWWFWKYERAPGQWVRLRELRRR